MARTELYDTIFKLLSSSIAMENLANSNEASRQNHRRSVVSQLLIASAFLFYFPLIFLVIFDFIDIHRFTSVYSVVLCILLIGIGWATLPGIVKYRCALPHSRRTAKLGLLKVFAAHWRGETPLWLSFWILFVGGSVVVTSLAVFASRSFEFGGVSYNPAQMLVAGIIYGIIVWSVWIWQMVGVLRAADRYKGAKSELNKSAHWGTVAQIAVILATLLRVIVSSDEYLPQVIDTARVVIKNDPSLPSYAIQVSDDGTEMEISGGIKFGLANEVASILNSEKIRVIRLKSKGGRGPEAAKLFYLIRDRQLTTSVSDECLSACIMVFAAGRERVMKTSAVLGFHSAAAYFGAPPGESTGQQREILTIAGFDERFISKMLSTPSNKMLTPNVTELLDAKVITSIEESSK